MHHWRVKVEKALGDGEASGTYLHMLAPEIVRLHNEPPTLKEYSEHGFVNCSCRWLDRINS